jgi:hypothetical protein
MIGHVSISVWAISMRPASKSRIRCRNEQIHQFCLNAQKRGWDFCATKSINAHETETAVIAHPRVFPENVQW